MRRRRDGQPARAEHFAERVGREREAMLDLIDAEICVRREMGDPVDAAEFRDRFPDLAEPLAVLLRIDADEEGADEFSVDESLATKTAASKPSRVRRPRATARAGPRRLGGYQIIRLLGRGAMGDVFEARQISLDRPVALKRIRSRIAKRPTALARFTREAYAASRLSHHNVVQIYDFGDDAGQHFFSMEWVRGGTLAELVRRQGPLECRVAATYILQAARGVQAAHRLGMTHRDIKPANLLLATDGTVKLADLGLVKIADLEEIGETQAIGKDVTMDGSAVGTPPTWLPSNASMRRPPIIALICIRWDARCGF